MSISGALATANSGLVAGGDRIAAAADNIVNADTPGYRPVEVVSISVVTPNGTGGVQSHVRTDLSEENLLQSAGADGESADVDIAREFIRMILARSAYQASAETMRAAEEMSRTLVDISA